MWLKVSRVICAPPSLGEWQTHQITENNCSQYKMNWYPGGKVLLTSLDLCKDRSSKKSKVHHSAIQPIKDWKPNCQVVHLHLWAGIHAIPVALGVCSNTPEIGTRRTGRDVSAGERAASMHFVFPHHQEATYLFSCGGLLPFKHYNCIRRYFTEGGWYRYPSSSSSHNIKRAP